MKKILLSFLLAVSSLMFSQIIIGDELGTTTTKTSVLLEFSKAENRGIILPYVKSLPANPSEGTMLLDASTSTSAKIKYYKGEWVDLTNDQDRYPFDMTTILGQQPVVEEGSNAKTIIGAATTSADGVLVLESTDKAMVLPTVVNIDDIVNPSPGMMVYVSSTKVLALYNGAKWSFWTAGTP